MILTQYTLLKRIEERTPLWTGDYTLKSIRTFLDGYCLALGDNGIENGCNDIDPFF